MSAGWPRSAAWRRTDEVAGHSMARLGVRDGGWIAHGTEVVAGPKPLSCWFTVEVDARWRTTQVAVGAVSERGERSLHLRADAERRWSRDGVWAPELEGCLDVDVAATPLTNTFPICRLAGLEIGSAVSFPVAWVDVPSLQVTRVHQIYRRLGEQTWEYADAVRGAFRLEVDEVGLVLDYEGFATRV